MSKWKSYNSLIRNAEILDETSNQPSRTPVLLPGCLDLRCPLQNVTDIILLAVNTDCVDACASRSNCTYFIYGKKNSRGLCYVQTGKIAKPIFTRDKKPTFPFTHNELCPNGKVTTVYDFFYMAVREKQKNKLKKIRKHKKKHPYSKKVHYYDIYDTTYCATAP